MNLTHCIFRRNYRKSKNFEGKPLSTRPPSVRGPKDCRLKRSSKNMFPLAEITFPLVETNFPLGEFRFPLAENKFPSSELTKLFAEIKFCDHSKIRIRTKNTYQKHAMGQMKNHNFCKIKKRLRVKFQNLDRGRTIKSPTPNPRPP